VSSLEVFIYLEMDESLSIFHLTCHCYRRVCYRPSNRNYCQHQFNRRRKKHLRGR